MKIEQIVDIFVKQIGARKDGPVYLVPDTVEVSVFVALPSELLQVPRVARFETAEGLVYLETHKGDRVIARGEDVSVVKIDRADGSKRLGSAGFGK